MRARPLPSIRRLDAWSWVSSSLDATFLRGIPSVPEKGLSPYRSNLLEVTPPAPEFFPAYSPPIAASRGGGVWCPPISAFSEVLVKRLSPFVHYLLDEGE